MVSLYVNKNVVFLSKDQKDYPIFTSSFLVKYESVTKLDYFNSTRSKKKFKTVKERRDLYNENDKFIIFSRGLLEMIPREYYTVQDISDGDHIISPSLSFEEIKKTLDTFDLRDDQVVAVNKCLTVKRGVVQLPTATGKSAIITSVIKRLQEANPEMKFLVLAPTLSTVSNINNTLRSNGLVTSIFGHPSKEITTNITTSLVQSLVSMSDKKPDLLNGIDAVFYDECLPFNSKILLPDGTVEKIGNIYDNDNITEVLSFNLDKKTYEVKRIVRKFRTEYNSKFYKVYYYDKVNKCQKGISCTPNHKIYTRNKGYVEAQYLTCEDEIKVDYVAGRSFNLHLESTTYSKVIKVVPNVGSVAKYKYNLEIEDNHNYFANNVLVSNCHHLKCDTWNSLNLMLPNAEYSLGFSALAIDKSEVYLRDIRQVSYDTALIVGSSGPVIMHMDPSYYIKKGIIALPVVFRVRHDDKIPDNVDQSDWHKVVKLGLMSTSRTDKIARVASMFSKYGRKVLILVSEKEYAFSLCRFLVHYGCTDFGVSFGAGVGYTYKSLMPSDKDEIVVDYNNVNSLEVLDKLSRDEISVLIGSSHIDEGVDLSKLDVVILASGGKKDRRIVQRLGRVLRKSKNGKYAYVVDFTDSGYAVLSRQSKLRLKMYRNEIGVPEENIFDNIPVELIEEKFKELET